MMPESGNTIRQQTLVSPTPRDAGLETTIRVRLYENAVDVYDLTPDGEVHAKRVMDTLMNAADVITTKLVVLQERFATRSAA
jgi:hypothetical protein